MFIRQETPQEHDQIHDLVKVAFQTAKVSNGKEQDFVDQLRNSGNYIPDLALVAEENEILIGHIMLTKKSIATNNTEIETLLLAPLSVVLEYRNKGVGSRLIKKSFDLARLLGYKSVCLVGDPTYYHRFGFRCSSDFGIKPENDIPSQYVLACELAPNSLQGINGTIRF